MVQIRRRHNTDLYFGLGTVSEGKHSWVLLSQLITITI